MPPTHPSLDELFSLAYEELRRLAATVRQNDPNSSLSPTALVHEAWLKLQGRAGVTTESRLHFRRLAARAMRQIVVDLARRRLTEKRGAGPALITYGDDLNDAGPTGDDVLLLHDTLESLATHAPRQARVVELRYFGGFDIHEIAELLEVGPATVSRDWRAAKAWLGAHLAHDAAPVDGKRA
ncbi:MAG: sigma-70 family RNA polymerase sigma factor [Gemmatimonadales bacterium]|nr:sigma-70 family RNA polymerase sigma factor [Gemmatimonadales bacterium]